MPANGLNRPVPLREIATGGFERLPVLGDEFARVLGGGIVPGSIVLVSGDPGIGKSTLMLQMALEMAATKRVLYVSGEESARQIKLRGERLGINPENLYLLAETCLERIFEEIDRVTAPKSLHGKAFLPTTDMA